MRKTIGVFAALVGMTAYAMASTTWFVDAQSGSNCNSGLGTLAPKRTIQAAINAAADGDSVIVAGGTYNENLTLSKSLTLFASEPTVAIVNGRYAGHCLLITENAAGCVIDGLVFTHGAPTNSGNKYGGGINCLADATIRNCIFKDNGNSSTTFAGGLHTDRGAQVAVENCLFVGNYAWAAGGATLTEGYSTATFDRCTFYGNFSADSFGNIGGICPANTGTVIVRSSIVWGNTGSQIASYRYTYAVPTTHVSYSCIQGGFRTDGPGSFYDDGGNISANPRFINADQYNFWFDESSPCWRKGDPNYLDSEGNRIHMGYWPDSERHLPLPVALQVEITLDAQGGDCSAKVVYRNEDDNFGNLPEPQYDGFDFLGWFDKPTGGRQIFPTERVSGDCTLYAQWKRRASPLFNIAGELDGITSYVDLEYRLEDGARDCKLFLNGELLTSTEEKSSMWTWQPRKLGKNTFVYETGHTSLTTTVAVAGFTFDESPASIPPQVLISPEDIEVEFEGGSTSIGIDLGGGDVWDACPNVDWITIRPTHGVSSGAIDCTIAPYNEVATRVGTVTLGGRIVTVFQYGRRIKLSDYSFETDYLTHVMPITVDALGSTEWSALPNAKWISIVDADNGKNRKGAGFVTVAISENPSYRARTGTIRIGTEVVSITQAGRPISVCEMAISPIEATADVNGANGHIAVTATPDLPWTVSSDTSWLTLLESTMVGTGNGNVFYTVPPNHSLYPRTGSIVIESISPDMTPLTHTIVQAGVVATISPAGYEFEAAGGAAQVEVSVSEMVEWAAVEAPDWIIVLGGTPHVGTGTVALQASPNRTIYARRGTVKIAERTFTVAQKGRGFTIDSEDGVVFDADGGIESFTVAPDGDMSWEAVASDSWITFLYGSNVGSGAGEVIFSVASCDGGNTRTGSITIGDKTILVSQRAYDLSISPRAAEVPGNAGTGEINVSTGIGNVWHAVRSGDWIAVEQGCDSGTGSGTVRFSYTANDTGLVRTGKIVIDGEFYTITQQPRVLVDISASVLGHGHVDGAGLHSLGSQVTLTAIPDDGYVFQRWTGAADNTAQNPITLTADAAKSVVAIFTPIAPEFVSAESSSEGVSLKWTNLGWAAEYRIYRASSGEMPSAPIATLASDGTCTYVDASADEEELFWYWVEAVGTDAQTVSQNPVTGMKLKPVVIAPSLSGDDGATVRGDAEDGWVVVPSANKTDVVVTIPEEIRAEKVTVEVGVDVATVVHNGANVRVVKNGHDITAYLDISDNGRVALVATATVKPEIVREPLDPSKGAVIDLDPDSPTLTTSATRPGLTYTLREGVTLKMMSDGASKVGDGRPWTPPITVKGGPCGFYTIKVEK